MAFILMVTIPVGAQSPPRWEDPLTEDERAWLADHGPIRYSADPFYPPYDFLDEEGRLQGINMDLLRLIEFQLRVDIEVVRSPDWNHAYDSALKGEVDVLGAVARTESREPLFDFVGPYARESLAFFVLENRLDLRDADELTGQKVGVIQGYASAERLKAADTEYAIIEQEDTTTALRALATGDLDAVYQSIAVVGFHGRDQTLPPVRMLPQQSEVLDFHLAVPKDNPQLVSILQKGLDALSPGEVVNVFTYWTGIDLTIRPDPTADPLLSATMRIALFGAFGLMGTAIIWGSTLRRVVNRRTADLQKTSVALENELERRRGVEKELRDLNEELEQRVHQRTQRLRSLNEELEAFSYAVSHDLRQPLSQMNMLVYLLAKKGEGRADPEEGKWLGSATKTLKRMDEMIQGLLDLSKVDRRELDVEQVDVSDIAWRVAERLEANADEHRPEMHIEDGISMTGDRKLIETVMENLIGNAWKYTKGIDAPRIAIGHEPAGEDVVLFVRDNGVGFDMAEAGRLFTPFQRLHKERSGFGIGLSTVKRIIDRHGGRIRAESRPGEGATFWLTLPRLVLPVEPDLGLDDALVPNVMEPRRAPSG